MLDEMRHPIEWFEWIAFSELEPLGELRADIRSGIVAQTMAEIHRDHKKRSRPYRVQEFMPKVKEPPRRQQPWKEMLSFAVDYTKAAGGRDLRPVGELEEWPLQS